MFLPEAALPWALGGWYAGTGWVLVAELCAGLVWGQAGIS